MLADDGLQIRRETRNLWEHLREAQPHVEVLQNGGVLVHGHVGDDTGGGLLIDGQQLGGINHDVEADVGHDVAAEFDLPTAQSERVLSIRFCAKRPRRVVHEPHLHQPVQFQIADANFDAGILRHLPRFERRRAAEIGHLLLERFILAFQFFDALLEVLVLLRLLLQRLQPILHRRLLRRDDARTCQKHPARYGHQHQFFHVHIPSVWQEGYSGHSPGDYSPVGIFFRDFAVRLEAVSAARNLVGDWPVCFLKTSLKYGMA